MQLFSFAVKFDVILSEFYFKKYILSFILRQPAHVESLDHAPTCEKKINQQRENKYNVVVKKKIYVHIKKK